jgi:hypothetical protein
MFRYLRIKAFMELVDAQKYPEPVFPSSRHTTAGGEERDTSATSEERDTSAATVAI